jgi:hypothetical protein
MNETVQRAAHTARTMLNQRTGERKAIERFLDLAEKGEEVDTIISDLRLSHRDVCTWMESAPRTLQEREEEEAAADMYRVLLCTLGVRLEDWRGPAERAVLEQDCLTVYDYGLLVFALSVCRPYQRSGSPQQVLGDLMNKLEHLQALDYPQCAQTQEGEEAHGRDNG